MDVDYWLDSWDKGEIGFNQSKSNPLMKEYIHRLELKKGATIFVPLCGKSIDMRWLLEAGYQVVGVEISQLAVESFFSESGLAYTSTNAESGVRIYRGEQVSVLQGDFFALSARDIGRVDAIYDKASMVAFPLAKRHAYLQQLARLTPDSPPILLIVVNYNQSKIEGPPFSWNKQALEAIFGTTYQLDQLAVKRRDAPPSLKQRGLDEYLEEVYMVKKVC